MSSGGAQIRASQWVSGVQRVDAPRPAQVLGHGGARAGFSFATEQHALLAKTISAKQRAEPRNEAFRAWLGENQPAPGVELSVGCATATRDEATLAKLDEKRKQYRFAEPTDDMPPHIASPLPRSEYRADRIESQLRKTAFLTFFADVVQLIVLHQKKHFATAWIIWGGLTATLRSDCCGWSSLGAGLFSVVLVAMLLFLRWGAYYVTGGSLRKPSGQHLLPLAVGCVACFYASYHSISAALAATTIFILAEMAASDKLGLLTSYSDYEDLYALWMRDPAACGSEWPSQKVARVGLMAMDSVKHRMCREARSRSPSPGPTAEPRRCMQPQAWQDDGFFAQQRVAGLNPMVLRRVQHRGELSRGYYESDAVGFVLTRAVPSLAARIRSHGGKCTSRPTIKANEAADRQQRLRFNAQLLEAVLEDGRLFECDFAAHLCGSPPMVETQNTTSAMELAAGRYMLVPHALFVTDEATGVLKAVGIRVWLERQGRYLVISPADTDLDTKDSTDLETKHQRWQLAKMIVQSADAHVHLAIHHLAFTHFLVEPFVIATHRQLPTQHPVFQLLLPHLYQTLAINNFGRKVMVKYPDGIVEDVAATGALPFCQIMCDAYRRSDFRKMNFEVDLAIRGVSSDSTLRHFPYRDDARRVNATIRGYVSEVISCFYSTDSAVYHDHEIQAWGQELGAPVQGWPRGRVPGFFDKSQMEKNRICTREELIQLLAQLIFTCTLQHAALNNNQFEFGGFVPSSPLAFYKPLEPLLTRKQLRESDLVAALPPQLKASKQVSFSYFLSFSSPCPSLDELANPAIASNAKTRDAYRHFKSNLTEVVAQIEEANAVRRAAGVLEYTHASPAACNVSIGI